MSAAFIQALTDLLRVVGVCNFFVGAAVTVILLMIKRRYNDNRKEREANIAFAEKDRTIQRLANDSRAYKVLYLKTQGVSEEELDKLFIKNQFDDGKESREYLEDGKQK